MQLVRDVRLANIISDWHLLLSHRISVLLRFNAGIFQRKYGPVLHFTEPIESNWNKSKDRLESSLYFPRAERGI